MRRAWRWSHGRFAGQVDWTDVLSITSSTSLALAEVCEPGRCRQSTPLLPTSGSLEIQIVWDDAGVGHHTAV
jgi:hypothetical protein